jgi:integrase
MEMSQIVPKKRKSRKLPKSVRKEEWDKLVKVIPTKDKTAMVAFLLAYGSSMRLSEVCRCDPKHFRSNSIFIPESKYGVERIVPLAKGWRKSFLDYLPIKCSSRTLQRKFKMYAKKAELNPLYTFHSLRHGWATRALESGMPINQVQLGLGHANIATTSIYTKAAPEDLLKSYEEKF